MTEGSQLNGTVLRITGLPTGTGEGATFTLSGTGLERGSALGRPSWVEIDGLDIAAIGGKDAIDRKVQGTLADGRFVEVELGEAIPLTGEDVGARVRIAAQSVRCTDYRPPGWGKPTWMFSVLNFK